MKTIAANMPIGLSDFTLNEIDWRSSVIQDELKQWENDNGWMSDADVNAYVTEQEQCCKVSAAQSIRVLTGCTELHASLRDVLSNIDTSTSEGKRQACALFTDLARAGAIPQHDPEAVRMGRKPRKAVVDGITYDNDYGFTYRQPQMVVRSGCLRHK
jgi:hypothetical protein